MNDFYELEIEIDRSMKFKMLEMLKVAQWDNPHQEALVNLFSVNTAKALKLLEKDLKLVFHTLSKDIIRVRSVKILPMASKYQRTVERKIN